MNNHNKPTDTMPVMHSSILEWPRWVKRVTVLCLDVALALLATWLAFSLRLDTLHRPQGAQWYVYLAAPALALPIFVRFGLYRAIFRYNGLAALWATGIATAVYGGLLFCLLISLQRAGYYGIIPRSVGVLQPLIFLMLVGCSRALARFWLTDLLSQRQHSKRRLLIYGAGNAGVQTAAGMGSTGQFTLIGFVDDDNKKAGSSINNLRVFAPTQIPDLLAKEGITDILLAMPSVSRARRHTIIDHLSQFPVHVRTLPGLTDLAQGRVTVDDIRELDVDDLLGREPVPPQIELLARNLYGKAVLVTGAAGSIGSELCRQIIHAGPRQLLLYDHSEFGLYTLHQELLTRSASLAVKIDLVPLLGSVCHAQRLSAVMAQYRPATVYHAAAYKHVPLVESNVTEGVKNNVLGTLYAARAAMENGAAHFVLVSTDKAVRPTNVMGASKRVAELILQALAASKSVRWDDGLTSVNNTCFAMVRFGNVLDSSGSVVPLFRRQLVGGGPLTVTHPDVTRYFMTIPEAAQLVLQASAMAKGGEVFLLEMGEPVKILDLARRMVVLSGLRVRETPDSDGDIEIAVTGLRPGEKLFEELLIGEDAHPTMHPRIMQASEEYLAWEHLQAQLRTLAQQIDMNDTDALLVSLRTLVPGFGPQFAHQDI